MPRAELPLDLSLVSVPLVEIGTIELVLPGVTVLELPSTLTVMQAVECFADESIVLLLDSTARIRPRDARYSFLTADPVQTIRLDHVTYGQEPFAKLREWQRMLPDAADATLPPFCGGIAGLMSYELGEAFERLPRPNVDEFATPALLAGLFDWCIVWDHIEATVKACVISLRSDLESSGRSATAGVQVDRRSIQRQQSRVDWISERLGRRDHASPGHLQTDDRHLDHSGGDARIHTFGVPNSPQMPGGHVLPLDHPEVVCSDFSPEHYMATVQRVVEYIRAGDIFQANLSQQLTTFWPGSAVELYRRLRERNPAPFCGFLKAADFSIISASPERFLRISRGRFVETRPIKGTRRRQQSPIADLFTSDELTSSEKDRAENVMIVDLLRNDLSRCCRPGSVRVTGLCEIELFQTVQHLVSTVVGELRDDRDIWDLCSGCFPGGSITGAPKIRAMQIIAELEPVVRGAYCGSLFYAGPQADFDSSILIRTFTLKDGRLQFPVGGGIVADSNPEDEYRETLHKASGMLRVLTGRPSNA